MGPDRIHIDTGGGFPGYTEKRCAQTAGGYRRQSASFDKLDRNFREKIQRRIILTKSIVQQAYCRTGSHPLRGWTACPAVRSCLKFGHCYLEFVPDFYVGISPAFGVSQS